MTPPGTAVFFPGCGLQESDYLISEHVHSYFEDIHRTMEIFKNEMWNFKSDLTSSVQEVNLLLSKYSEEMAMDGKFIAYVSKYVFKTSFLQLPPSLKAAGATSGCLRKKVGHSWGSIDVFRKSHK